MRMTRTFRSGAQEEISEPMVIGGVTVGLIILRRAAL